MRCREGKIVTDYGLVARLSEREWRRRKSRLVPETIALEPPKFFRSDPAIQISMGATLRTLPCLYDYKYTAVLTPQFSGPIHYYVTIIYSILKYTKLPKVT